MSLQPGDLIFYPSSNKVVSRVIVGLQKFFGQTGGDPNSYYHVAMVVDTDTLIEYTWPKCRTRSISADPDRKVCFTVNCSDTIKQDAIKWSYTQLGKRYSILSYVLGYFGIKDAIRECSGYIQTAYQRGSDNTLFLVEKQDLVSPDELATSTYLTPTEE